MKRALAALAALCLLAAPVAGKGLVICGPTSLNNASYDVGERTLEQMYLTVLRNSGADFDVIRAEQLVNGTTVASPPQLVNQYLRSGKVWTLGWGVGTPSTYGLVINLGVSGSATYGAYHPDSLTLIGSTARGSFWPTVPHLMVANQNHSLNVFNLASTRCSTGVGAAINYGSNTQWDSTMNVYEVGNTSRTWKSRVGFVALSPRITRGWRPIVANVSTRLTNASSANGNYDLPEAACATCAYSTNPDTVALWVVLNNAAGTNTPIRGVVLGDSANAAPIIYAAVSHGQNTTSIDMGLLLASLQVADSLSGGALYGSAPDKLPLGMGVHIDDGWKRSESNVGDNGAGGIAMADSAALKVSIAGMNLLPGFKYALGCEADSLGDFINYDQRWWAAATNARLTPHCHAGQASTAPAHTQNVASKFMYPINIWGLNQGARMRYAFGGPENVDSLLVYGVPDYVAAVTDTMVTYWLSKRAFALCDSISTVMWGSPRTDHLVMPPADDWGNQRITHRADSTYCANSVDSVLAAAALSGASSVRSNASSANSSVVHNAASGGTYGYYTNAQRWTINASAVPSTFPVTVYGRPCPIIATTGYPNTTHTGSEPVGSRRGWSRQILGKPGDYNKALRGVFGIGTADIASTSWYSGGSSGIPSAGENVGGNVIAIHVADLGSNGVENTMPGYYNFKYLANAVAVANAHGRQPIVRFVWPEDLQP